jgi:Fe-S-cluster containining protein
MRKPLVFQCQQCGDCCAGRGGIFVRPGEVAAMAAFLHLDEADFRARYLEPSSLGTRLGITEGVCVFMEDHRCRVHPVKPLICRQWPYLPALLKDAEEFESAKGACPGIDPKSSHEDFVEEALRLQESPPGDL